MKRTNLKKLALDQITVRILADDSLRRVQGGMGYTDLCSGSCTGNGGTRCCEEISQVGCYSNPSHCPTTC
jgi:hypothetical protein